MCEWVEYVRELALKKTAKVGKMPEIAVLKAEIPADKHKLFNDCLALSCKTHPRLLRFPTN